MESAPWTGVGDLRGQVAPLRAVGRREMGRGLCVWRRAPVGSPPVAAVGRTDPAEVGVLEEERYEGLCVGGRLSPQEKSCP